MNMLLDTSNGPITMLATGLEFDVGQDIDKMDLPGVVLAPATRRAYPEGDLGSAYLGFLGREHKGLAGLESTLDETLSGKPGFLFFEQDGGGQPIAFGRNRIVPGTPGSDVRLTIDRYLQRLIETELDYQVKLHQASGGSIIDHGPQDRRHHGHDFSAPPSSSPSCRWRTRTSACCANAPSPTSTSPVL